MMRHNIWHDHSFLQEYLAGFSMLITMNILADDEEHWGFSRYLLMSILLTAYNKEW